MKNHSEGESYFDGPNISDRPSNRRMENWPLYLVMCVVIQLLSFVCLFAIPWTIACQASWVSWGLLKLMSIELVMPFNYVIFCHSLLLLPSIYPSIRVFSNELALCIRWPKYCSYSFSISPSNEYSGLVSFRIDQFNLAVQGDLKSLLQHRNLKTLIL